MYAYTEYDQQLLKERVAQYRNQTERYLGGKLSDEEFLALRLQNGLYVQRHAPMLRVAIPYGMLNSAQVRVLAEISRDFDKGYAHFSTRQNIQYNWPALELVPDILDKLASVQMHAIQTSGNCIRNVTTDQFAGVATDEIEDPRPYCEIIRQWSTFHPEFAYLPRKFKIAVNAAESDRAAIKFHDIGVEIVRDAAGNTAFDIWVGGGLGRTPIVAEKIISALPRKYLLSYLEAVLRVYNRYGRRDNKYKARIKILVKALGVDAFREKVDAEWQQMKDSEMDLPDAEIERMKGFFPAPAYQSLADNPAEMVEARAENLGFDAWIKRNCTAHKQSGYMAVTLSLKATSIAPGDVTTEELSAIADLADQFSFGEIRSTHKQNVVLADVRQDQLFDLWQQLKALGFATANIGCLTDVICCPGGDFCSLANAKSIPIAEQIQRRFDDLDYLYDLGEIELNISGCMNACGHHHIGNIGILGVDKKGEEYYQVSLGGNSGRDAKIGKIVGPSFFENDIADVITKIIDVYVEKRIEGESFQSTYERVGMAPFKERVYAA
ncbi:nitrite/sulfite reductase [Ketobacter alkanivorans]|uniref:Sulfite reductase n=1 Tax=Ketobacter alkanivorans TaxID=1917421 RepID=A0A2K9LFZ0_9GAMM|nr:nitrite/sulfite reductase [Ketobacter alkanivorans]AUM11160.1 sulfite reductase [Ketobacter alkanivorans]